MITQSEWYYSFLLYSFADKRQLEYSKQYMHHQLMDEHKKRQQADVEDGCEKGGGGGGEHKEGKYEGERDEEMQKCAWKRQIRFNDSIPLATILR